MHIFLFFRNITLQFFFFLLAPFTNYFSLWIVDNMPCSPYLVFESKNPKALHRFIGLLESKSVSLRSRVKAGISFIESKRNTSVETSNSKSYSAYSTTNNGNMWVIFCIKRCIVMRWEKSRSHAMVTFTYMPLGLNRDRSGVITILVFMQLFLIPTLRFFGEFLYFFTHPITLGTDGPFVCDVF